MRSARAKALNTVSHWWCALSPRRLSMCSVTKAWLAKPWKNSCASWAVEGADHAALERHVHDQARAGRRNRSPRATAPRRAARRRGRSGGCPSCRRPPWPTAWPSVMPTSSTVWWPSMCRSPWASISRSIRPWRAIWSSMWSKKPMPVDELGAAGAVEVDRDADLRFRGVARDDPRARGGTVVGCQGGVHRRLAQGREHLRVLVGGADRQAQAVGQQRMHSRNVLDQHAARLHALEGFAASGTRTRIMLASLGQACDAGQAGQRAAAAARARARSVRRLGARTRRRAPGRTAPPRQFSTLML